MAIIKNMCQQRYAGNGNFNLIVSLLAGVGVMFSVVSAGILRLPEFAEPIKNVTLPFGSDVELSCDVRHLGTYRVTWSWKRGDEQKLLAIGIVKIAHNQRMHISRIQKSDDVTQFNLYVYNVKEEDEGIYFCSVNSNPMIEQYGILDVTGDDTSEVIRNHYNGNNVQIFSGQQSTIPLLKADDSSQANNSTDTILTKSTLENFSDNSKGNSTSPSLQISQTQNEDSNVLCIDLGEVLENARERLSEFLSALMKFTYSYWFS